MAAIKPVRLHRPTIGAVAVLLLLGSVALAVWYPSEASQLWMSACLRVGLVMGLLWLAYPQLSQLRPWLIAVIVAIVFAGLLLARQPRVLLIAVAILVVIMRFRPRSAR